MLGNLEARRGKLHECVVLVEEAKPGLSAVENHTVPLQFYSTLGEVHLKGGERDAAVKALRSPISIGQIGVPAMKGDHDRLVCDRPVGKAYRNMVRLLFLDDNKSEDAH